DQRDARRLPPQQANPRRVSSTGAEQSLAERRLLRRIGRLYQCPALHILPECLAKPKPHTMVAGGFSDGPACTPQLAATRCTTTFHLTHPKVFSAPFVRADDSATDTGPNPFACAVDS